MDELLCFGFQMVLIMIMVILILLFFFIKDTKLFVPVVTLSAKDNQKLSKLLSKGLERSAYWMNIKQNVRRKIWQMRMDIFLFQTLKELTDNLC